jgi:hypothetical protein
MIWVIMGLRQFAKYLKKGLLYNQERLLLNRKQVYTIAMGRIPYGYRTHGVQFHQK